MGKRNLLSSQVSKLRALSLAGQPIGGLAQELRAWILVAPEKGRAKPSPSILSWGTVLELALRKAEPLGAPVNTLLGEMYPLVRREERLCERLRSLESVFAFQAAIALVLPWVVVSLGFGFEVNLFLSLGIFLQVFGTIIFSYWIWKLRKTKRDENSYLFDFLLQCWMHACAGLPLQAAISDALESTETNFYLKSWNEWFSTLQQNELKKHDFRWPEKLTHSPGLAKTLGIFIKTGAPANQFLLQTLNQMHDERQDALEEDILHFPNRLSLLFCTFFAPAMFCICFSSLWPQLKLLFDEVL